MVVNWSMDRPRFLLTSFRACMYLSLSVIESIQVSVRCRWRGRLLETWIKAARENPSDLEIIDGLWDDYVEWAILHVADSVNIKNER